MYKMIKLVSCQLDKNENFFKIKNVILRIQIYIFFSRSLFNFKITFSGSPRKKKQKKNVSTIRVMNEIKKNRSRVKNFAGKRVN